MRFCKLARVQTSDNICSSCTLIVTFQGSFTHDCDFSGDSLVYSIVYWIGHIILHLLGGLDISRALE